MSRRRFRMVAAGLLVGHVLVAWSASADAALGQTPVSASASKSVAEVGDVVQVGGSGWPEQVEIQVQLCGNQARRGSSDCDATNTATTVSSAGRFGLSLRVSLPPKPCPCVIWVTTPAAQDNVRIPIEITGVAERAPDESPTLPVGGLDIVSASVEGIGGIASWMGMEPKRTLRITVDNNTSEPLPVSLAVSIALPGGETQIVKVPDFEPVSPGERTVLAVPIYLRRWEWGRFTVAGTVNQGSQAEGFRIGTSTYPFGLLAALAALALVAYLLVRADRRRHRGRHVARGRPVARESVQAGV